MALFEIELLPVEDIEPWRGDHGPYLSAFALTDGWFHMPVGDEVLFEYTSEILAHWELQEPRRYVNYHLDWIVQDVLGGVSAATARLPERVERLAADWNLLSDLRHDPVPFTVDAEDREDLERAAWWWLAERSIDSAYLVQGPRVRTVRIGDDVHVQWDNRDRTIDGIPLWTARRGVFVLPVEAYVEECRGLLRRMVHELESRTAAIAAGTARPRAPVDVAALRRYDASWRKSLGEDFGPYEPDIDWEEAEEALGRFVNARGLPF